MTTTLIQPLPSAVRMPRPWPRLLTVADLAKMPTSLPDGDVRYEPDNGDLVVLALPGFEHSRRQNKADRYLTVEAELKGLGLSCPEVSVVLRRNPDRVLGPDVAFLTTDQLPVRLTREGYLETIPKLVVEIRSKSDTLAEIESKVAEYLAAGVVEAWVLDPENRTIAKHRGDGVVRLATTEWLTSDLLPGFRVAVQLFFAD